MPLINSPIPRAPQPRFYRGSDLRSVRDADRPDKLWQKNRVGSFSISVIQAELFRLKQDLGRLRRRIVGGGGGTSTSGVDYAGQWSSTTSYAAKTIVRFTPDGSPAAGTYISNQAVPAGIAPDTGLPYWTSFTDSAAGMFI